MKPAGFRPIFQSTTHSTPGYRWLSQTLRKNSRGLPNTSQHVQLTFKVPIHASPLTGPRPCRKSFTLARSRPEDQARTAVKVHPVKMSRVKKSRIKKEQEQPDIATRQNQHTHQINASQKQTHPERIGARCRFLTAPRSMKTNSTRSPLTR